MAERVREHDQWTPGVTEVAKKAIKRVDAEKSGARKVKDALLAKERLRRPLFEVARNSGSPAHPLLKELYRVSQRHPDRPASPYDGGHVSLARVKGKQVKGGHLASNYPGQGFFESTQGPLYFSKVRKTTFPSAVKVESDVDAINEKVSVIATKVLGSNSERFIAEVGEGYRVEGYCDKTLFQTRATLYPIFFSADYIKGQDVSIFEGQAAIQAKRIEAALQNAKRFPVYTYGGKQVFDVGQPFGLRGVYFTLTDAQVKKL